MGLDWLPGNKAKAGFEAEFADLFGRLNAADSEKERDGLLARFREISLTAFETLGAPLVGHDPQADEWARQMYREMDQIDDSEAQFLVEMEGFAVLPLVAPCDGLPRYSNGSPGGYVEQYSFRAQFLHDCAEDIGKDLFEAAYESKLSGELLVYGQQLLAKAEELAARHGLDPMNLVIPEEVPSEEEYAAGRRAPETWSVEHRIDVAHCAGRWCVFWAERGHFLDAWS